MPEFLVESSVARTDADAFARGAERAREAADLLTRTGSAVRLLRGMFIPEEETVYYVWEVASTDEVREAARRAAIDFTSVARRSPTASPGIEAVPPIETTGGDSCPSAVNAPGRRSSSPFS